MDYEYLINKAIKQNEVLKLLRGENEYELVVSEFSSDIFPTDINMVLVNCFYKQKKSIKDIDNIFFNAINKLLSGTASDVYIAILYFDTCIFQEEKNKATFLLDKECLAQEIKKAVSVNKKELQDKIEFSNGMIKQNPWRNIENFNKYYCKKYGFSILS